jgi:hypothetical protein
MLNRVAPLRYPLRYQCGPNARQDRGPTSDLPALRVAAVSWRRIVVGVRPLSPRRLAAFDHLLENLLVPQRIHSPPKTFLLIRHQLPGFDQTVERLNHQFLRDLNIVEDLPAKDKIAAIDPNIGLMTGPYAIHGSLFIELSQVKAHQRMNRKEAANLADIISP